MWWQLKTQNLKILYDKNILVFIHSRQKYCIAFVVLSFLAICMQSNHDRTKKNQSKSPSQQCRERIVVKCPQYAPVDAPGILKFRTIQCIRVEDDGFLISLFQALRLGSAGIKEARTWKQNGRKLPFFSSPPPLPPPPFSRTFHFRVFPWEPGVNYLMTL